MKEAIKEGLEIEVLLFIQPFSNVVKAVKIEGLDDLEFLLTSLQRSERGKNGGTRCPKVFVTPISN